MPDPSGAPSGPLRLAHGLRSGLLFLRSRGLMVPESLPERSGVFLGGMWGKGRSARGRESVREGVGG